MTWAWGNLIVEESQEGTGDHPPRLYTLRTYW
jgi:hypothetical protein